MTFRERFLNGHADFEEIYDLTDAWSFSDETCTLREYLGLTADEEDIWISQSDEALEDFMEQERKRKLFLTDIDSTLLNDRKEITPETRKELQRILSENHAVCISTGRALRSAKNLAASLDLMHKGCYIIAYNGGQIYDIENRKIIFSASIPMDLIRLCFDEANEYGINIQTYDEEDVLVEKEHPDLFKYCKIQNLPYRVTEDVTKYMKECPPKMLVTDMEHPDRVAEFRRRIEEKTGDRLDLFMSQPTYLEIVPPEINKGNALRTLCEYLNIPVTHTVAAGDAENDIQMLKAAHVGVCMANGDPEVKAQADYVTVLDNNHDGVAEILKKFF